MGPIPVAFKIHGIGQGYQFCVLLVKAPSFNVIVESVVVVNDPLKVPLTALFALLVITIFPEVA